MTNTAATLAEIANKAEAELLATMPAEFRGWYLDLPREVRVEMAQEAFATAAQSLG